MMRIAILAIFVALLASDGLVAANRWIAIGDSITVGSSWPVTGCPQCSKTFDCVGGCGINTQALRDKCGYVRRLDDWLGGGSDNYVKNEGIGGEDTMGALSRFEAEMNSNCAGSPGECIAVLLMHGTNDMFVGASPESARDNLSDMIDIAKERNVDVLLMSIIRRVYDMNNVMWQDYRDLVAALAAAKDLQFVDPHGPLCNNNWSCYNRNYWVNQMAPVNEGPTNCTGPTDGDNNLGHLDPDGYNVLTGLIQAAFPSSVPAAPSPTSPTGSICDSMPDFVWPEVSSARWYRLTVNGSVTWWEGAAICSGGTCTANPGVTLPAGNITWSVLGRNLRGLGAPSANNNFTVVTAAPSAPTTNGPTGDYFEHTPRYDWLEQPGTTSYDVEVKDAGGNVDYQAAGLAATAVCFTGVCSHVGSLLSTPDDYTFRVRGQNACGPGPYSSPGADFTILPCNDPTPMDLHDLEPSPVVGPTQVIYCGALSAPVSQPGYTVQATGDLSVHTRDGFAMLNGFSVEPGGKLSIKSP